MLASLEHPLVLVWGYGLRSQAFTNPSTYLRLVSPISFILLLTPPTNFTIYFFSSWCRDRWPRVLADLQGSEHSILGAFPGAYLFLYRLLVLQGHFLHSAWAPSQHNIKPNMNTHTLFFLPFPSRLPPFGQRSFTVSFIHNTALLTYTLKMAPTSSRLAGERKSSSKVAPVCLPRNSCVFSANIFVHSVSPQQLCTSPKAEFSPFSTHTRWIFALACHASWIFASHRSSQLYRTGLSPLEPCTNFSSHSCSWLNSRRLILLAINNNNLSR